MKQVLVTGARGFIGSNLMVRLSERSDVSAFEFDIQDSDETLFGALDKTDYVFHLAGVNRPKDPKEFEIGNADLTRKITDYLSNHNLCPVMIATSSTQAAMDNPYGLSKRQAEDELFSYADKQRAPTYVYRLTNVFGKWSRPFYNSVVATFCHQVAHGIVPTVHDPDAVVAFIYVDDLISSFLGIVDGRPPDSDGRFYTVQPQLSISVGDLSSRLQSFAQSREDGILPDLSDSLTKYLYSTFLTYLEPQNLQYSADKKSDPRGYLFELLKSRTSGQIFVSRTRSGITRGNHYHHTKVEKFCVIEGTARISLCHIITAERIDFEVEGAECKIVDIPPGYSHSITNIGQDDLLTLFWANEIFDPDRPDTYSHEV